MVSEERRPRRVQSKQSAEAFEAKMKSFLRDSKNACHDLKRNTEGKRRKAEAVVEINSERWLSAISLLMYKIVRGQ